MGDKATQEDAPVPPGARPPGSEPLGIDAARFHVRDVGFCVLCDRFVERGPAGACPRGHEPRHVAGRIIVEESEPLPKLPRFNIAAFLIPPVWGLVYGQWVSLFFVPLWVFVDEAFTYASSAGGAWFLGAYALAAITAGFQFLFAWRANGLAWRTVCDRQTIERFRRIQLIWAAAAIVVVALATVWVTLFRLGVRY